ncbi:MAG: hypothetical protein FI725_07155 [SAR202 cluster bacterium]|nr:hypothetical protein [SAR202 cluster bacterium]|tara:strand:+ start:14277 stop:18662 length:4386 start_codon:yes stop_codon:yes gene_type:complete
MPTYLRRSLQYVFSTSEGIFTLLLVVAFAIRIYGVQWDQGGLYHPDERQILMTASRLELPSTWAQFLDPKTSPLNPHFFAYGSFPMYLLEASTTMWETFTGLQADLIVRATIGRLISVLFDVSTIVFVYLLGRLLYHSRIGLLAAMLVSFSVLHVQLSHFYTVDTILTTFTIATVYFSARLLRNGNILNGLLAGIFLGLAASTKISVAPLFLVVAFAWYVSSAHLYPIPPDLRLLTRYQKRFGRFLVGASTSGVLAAMIFVFVQPYFVLDFGSFLTGISEQAQMARGAVDFPYTRQFIGTTPFWFHIYQLSWWGTGLPLGFCMWVGFLFVLVRSIRNKRPEDLLLVIWVGSYFLLTAGLQVKFMRYMLPITPILAIFAAILLWELRSFRLARLSNRKIGDWVITFVVGCSFLYTIAYVNIYSVEHPATRMSAWIQENVSSGSSIAQEHWDEPLRGLPETGFRVPQLPLYEPDSIFKARQIGEILEQSDYVAIYSQRLYSSIFTLKERYPLTSSYYRALFAGDLGFDLIRVEASFPNLFGFSLQNNATSSIGLSAPSAITSPMITARGLDLGFAQESFVAYDHPKVLLFKKTKEKTSKEYVEVFWDESQPLKSSLLLSSKEWDSQRDGVTWFRDFSLNSWANQYPVIVWYLAFQFIFLVTLPSGLLLFRPLADRGYLLIKVLSLIMVAYISWVLVSLTDASFSQPIIMLALTLVAGFSVITLSFRTNEIREFFRQRWRLVLFSEAIFLIAFLVFIWIRSANPDLWHPYRGGEKPMDFAYLNAIVRSTSLPPFDPWFSGGYLNYYYFGQFIVATLIKLTTILPQIAYNIAIPTFFALTFGSAFSVTYNLASFTKAHTYLKPYGRDLLVAGLLGGFFVVVVGNLDGAVQWAQGLVTAWKYIGMVIVPEIGFPTLGSLGESVNAHGFVGVFQWLRNVVFDSAPLAVGIWNAWSNEQLLTGFDYWRSSRMLPGNHITEFPFWTFLFADLHAHLIALPITILSLGLGLSLAFRINGYRSLMYLGTLANLGLLGLVLAVLWMTNAWDYPTYLMLAAAVVGIAFWIKKGSLLQGGLIAIACGSILFLTSQILSQPFGDHFESFYSGVILSTFRTPILNYLGIHGLPIVFILVMLTVLISRQMRSRVGTRLSIDRSWFHLKNLVLILAFVAVIWFFVNRQMYLSVVLIGIAALIVQYMVMGSKTLSHRFVGTILVMAFLIGIGVDLVTVQGDIDRMNTLFKFYLQAWVLFGIGAAYILWYLGSVGVFEGIKQSWGKRSLFAVITVFIFGASLYPIAALEPRLGDRFEKTSLTLDGLRYMDTAVYRDIRGSISLSFDKAAIDWIQWNIEGSPIIVEAVTPEYRWGGRVSVATGLPTVLGWNWHQRQQRGIYADQVVARHKAIDKFYSSPEEIDAEQFLQKYNVDYIYVGQLEDLYYPREGLHKFSRMAGNSLKIAYENEKVVIYEVVAASG